MPRPHNERGSDLEREENARKEIESVWKCMISPLEPAMYRVDWAIFKDKKTFVGWAEYKYRGQDKAGKPVKWETYPTVLLSLAKWVTLKTLAQQTSRQFFLFIEWADCIVYGRWPQFTGMGYPVSYGVELGGREDRNQAGDIEPVIAIPNKEFKIIGSIREQKAG